MKINHSGFFQSIKPMVASSFGSRRMPIAFQAQCHNTLVTKDVNETKPFTLISPEITKMCENSNTSWMSNRSTTYILGPGMILMKKYVSLKDQVDIVNICEKYGGFYEPINKSGDKVRLHMMCLGRNWDPITRYKNRFRSDGSEPPAIPAKLMSLVKTSIQDAQARLNKNELPSMRPDHCLANFYSPNYGRLGVHRDNHESSDSLKKGLPVVSISIGDTALFLYGHTKDRYKLNNVNLESGDVLIFGGKSRLIYHGVKHVIPSTSPLLLKLETALRPGRLNLTFRQI